MSASVQHVPRHLAAPALELDLIEFLHRLLRARWWVLGATLLGMACGVFYAMSRPDIYQAVARVDLVEMTDPGGVAPDDRRAPEMITLVEHGFALNASKDNQRFVTLAKLRSRRFTTLFMDEHNVYRHLYAEHWDANQEAWIDGFQADRGAAFKRFNEQIRFVHEDEVTGIVVIQMRWTDPVVARDWANAYVAQFNAFSQAQALAEIEQRQTFLQEQLARETVVQIRQSIYRLIEAQTAMTMLSKGRDEYALDIIDPATRPYDRFSPNRKRLVIYFTTLGLMLSLFAILAQIMLSRIRKAMADATPFAGDPLDEQRNNQIR